MIKDIFRHLRCLLAFSHHDDFVDRRSLLLNKVSLDFFKSFAEWSDELPPIRGNRRTRRQRLFHKAEGPKSRTVNCGRGTWTDEMKEKSQQGESHINGSFRRDAPRWIRWSYPEISVARRARGETWGVYLREGDSIPRQHYEDVHCQKAVTFALQSANITSVIVEQANEWASDQVYSNSRSHGECLFSAYRRSAENAETSA